MEKRFDSPGQSRKSLSFLSVEVLLVSACMVVWCVVWCSPVLLKLVLLPWLGDSLPEEVGYWMSESLAEWKQMYLAIIVSQKCTRITSRHLYYSMCSKCPSLAWAQAQMLMPFANTMLNNREYD